MHRSRKGSRSGMARRRVAAVLAILGVLWATTLSPLAHLIGHRDDHVHTELGIVPISHAHHHDADDDDDQAVDDDDDDAVDDDGDDHAHDHHHDRAPHHDHAAPRHDHRAGHHEHGRPSDPKHGAGSFEHGFALLVEAPLPPDAPFAPAIALSLSRLPLPEARGFALSRLLACRGPPARGASV